MRYLDESGQFGQTAIDASGRTVPWEEAVDVGIAPVIDDRLQALLDAPGARSANPTIEVDVSFRDEQLQAPIEVPYSERFELGGSEYVVNGRTVEREEFRRLAAEHDAQQELGRALRSVVRRELVGEMRARSVDVPAAAEAMFVAGNGSLVLELPLDEVEDFAASHADIVGAMGHHFDSLDDDDDLASAMADTRTQDAINAGFTGTGLGVYMTESGCAPNSYLTNYTRLSGSDLPHHRQTSSVLRAVAPGAYIYCRGASTLPTTSDLANPGPGGNPRVRLVSHSRTPGSWATGTYDTNTRDWDDFVYANNTLIVNSAGNNGTDPGQCNNTWRIEPPAGGVNLLTVGSYDDANDTIAASSCYDDLSDINSVKPEVSAPGVNINPCGTSSGGGSLGPCSGTSFSTPHVAGMGADLIDMQPTMWRAAQVKAFILKGARDPISGGGLAKVGYGGADFVTSAYNGGSAYYGGAQSSWSSWDAADPFPNNGVLDIAMAVPANTGLVRVVLAWLVKGSWAYDHRNDTYPLGLEFLFDILSPSGTYVTDELNRPSRGGFVVKEFTPAAAGGTYRMRVVMITPVPDSSNAIRLAAIWGW